LRLRGKGIQAPGGKGRGDQLVTLKVVLPPAVDDELTVFMQAWRQQHAYDPRAAMKERS
jgi:DnaJ-class molecular chaperone